MAPEAVKHIDLLSSDLADDLRLFGHLYYMARDPVLHSFARRHHHHLIQAVQKKDLLAQGSFLSLQRNGSRPFQLPVRPSPS